MRLKLSIEIEIEYSNFLLIELCVPNIKNENFKTKNFITLKTHFITILQTQEASPHILSLNGRSAYWLCIKGSLRKFKDIWLSHKYCDKTWFLKIGIHSLIFIQIFTVRVQFSFMWCAKWIAICKVFSVTKFSLLKEQL